MKSKLLQFLLLALFLLLVAGCTSSSLSPLEFSDAPWTDGESTRYDALRRDGSMMGSVVWTWQATAEGWRQAYSMHLDGRDISGWVEMDEALSPIRAERSGDKQQIDTSYESGRAKITQPDGAVTRINLQGVVVDNDSSLQQLRAVQFKEGYRAVYANFVPASAVVANVRAIVNGRETVEVPAGSFETWHITLDFDSGSHDAWYSVQEPYLLVRYVNNVSGSEFQLRSWQQAPGTPIQGNTQQPDTPMPEDEDYLPAMNTPFLAMSFLIQYPLMLVFPLFLGWWLKRRYGTRWALFGFGAMIFVASQAVHLPLNSVLGLLQGGKGVALLPLPLVALIAGLSAALCEEGSRWIALRFLIKHDRGWKPALQLGAGHGAAEAIIFGLLALTGVINLLVVQTTGLAQMGLTGEAAASMKSALAALWSNSWYMPLLAGLERLFAITCHIAMTVMVMRSFTSKKIAWLGAAIGFHTLLDFWAVWASSRTGTLVTEAGVAVLAVAAFLITRRLREEDVESAEA